MAHLFNAGSLLAWWPVSAARSRLHIGAGQFDAAPEGLCPAQVRMRFDTPAAAEKYAGSLNGSATDRREQRCVRRALADVPAGASVLDLPCGAGRLLPLLDRMGFHVTAADSSHHMVDRCRRYAHAMGLGVADSAVRVANVFDTGFATDAFDALVCNRLLHHFPAPSVRQQALCELHRICRGPIVVSFFRDLGLDALAFRLKCAARRRQPTDRVPIPLSQFEQDVNAAGLAVTRVLAARPFVSKQWYAVLQRRPECSQAAGWPRVAS